MIGKLSAKCCVYGIEVFRVPWLMINLWKDNEGVRHYLIDYIDPKQEYSLAQFKKDAEDGIGQIQSRSRVPFIVGGTGLYIDSVIYNYDLDKEDVDVGRREELRKMSTEQLQKELRSTDSDALARLTPSDQKNPHRMIRTIERRQNPRTQNSSPYNHFYLVLDANPDELKTKIEARVEEMFEEGLEDEIRTLLDSGVTFGHASMKSIGYKDEQNIIKNAAMVGNITVL